MAGTIQGQQFLVIFEDPNYMGPPVAHNFFGSIPGIKVRDNFFPGYGSNPSVSMGVDGEHYLTYIIFVPMYRDQVKDVVRFCRRPRPPLFSAFNEDGSLDNVKPQGSQSISRKFTGSTPVDTDGEQDWSSSVQSPGVPTPP